MSQESRCQFSSLSLKSSTKRIRGERRSYQLSASDRYSSHLVYQLSSDRLHQKPRRFLRTSRDSIYIEEMKIIEGIPCHPLLSDTGDSIPFLKLISNLQGIISIFPESPSKGHRICNSHKTTFAMLTFAPTQWMLGIHSLLCRVSAPLPLSRVLPSPPNHPLWFLYRHRLLSLVSELAH